MLPSILDVAHDNAARPILEGTTSTKNILSPTTHSPAEVRVRQSGGKLHLGYQELMEPSSGRRSPFMLRSFETEVIFYCRSAMISEGHDQHYQHYHGRSSSTTSTMEKILARPAV